MAPSAPFQVVVDALPQPHLLGDARQATSSRWLARVLLVEGDPTGARAHVERSLEIKRQVHGTEVHPDIATSLHELARVLRAQGDLAGARARLERSLDIQHQVHGTELHPDVATTFDGLGHCLRDLEILVESEQAFRTALRIRETVLGHRDHYMYAETEFALATLIERERPEEAIDMIRHVRAVLQARSPNHPILTMLQAAEHRAAGSDEPASSRQRAMHHGTL
jgi:tetratricopeptide (TPR) repeat protein